MDAESVVPGHGSDLGLAPFRAALALGDSPVNYRNDGYEKKQGPLDSRMMRSL